jgi:hypothetical protein
MEFARQGRGDEGHRQRARLHQPSAASGYVARPSCHRCLPSVLVFLGIGKKEQQKTKEEYFKDSFHGDASDSFVPYYHIYQHFKNLHLVFCVLLICCLFLWKAKPRFPLTKQGSCAYGIIKSIGRESPTTNPKIEF